MIEFCMHNYPLLSLIMQAGMLVAIGGFLATDRAFKKKVYRYFDENTNSHAIIATGILTLHGLHENGDNIERLKEHASYLREKQKIVEGVS